jgi:hypothetical protein
LDGLVGPRKPSADRLGEVFEEIDPEEQRLMLGEIHHQLGRNKVLNSRWPLRFVALDGHEFYSSKHRSGLECSTRKVTVNGEEVPEYYYRGVVAHLVGCEIPVPLDVELTLPGEDEVGTAKRLLKRLLKNSPRLFDGVVVDALYFQAPFVNLCRKHNKHVVGVAKGDERVLIKDAAGLFEKMAPSLWTPPRQQIRVWEAEGFTTFDGVDEPVRVLHTEETTHLRKRINRQWVEKTEVKNWWWFTTLPGFLFPTKMLWEVGHARWGIEDDLFHVLATYWSMDHCFRNHPVAIVNFVLVMFIAFILFQSFYHRNLKAPLRKLFTEIALRDEFHASLASFPPVYAPWVHGAPLPLPP